MSGRLKSGEKVVIKPKDNHAFSIARTKGMASSDASYNVKLVNGADIIYEDKNLVDDIYLVFHDDILPGDRMHIEVNRGYFDYHLTPLLKLPNIVKNVLEPEVFEKAKHKKHLKKKPKKKSRPAKEEVLKNAPIVPAVVVEENADKVVERKSVTVPPLESEISYTSPIGKTFFEKFTKIFKELVQSLSLNSSNAHAASVEKKAEAKKIAPIKQQTVKIKAALPRFNDGALKEAARLQEAKFTESKRGIQNSFDDSGLKNSVALERSTFSAPQRGLSENFDDDALQQSALVSKKVFNKPKAIAIDSQLPSHVEEKFPSLPSREPDLYKDVVSKGTEQVPTFNGVAPKSLDKMPQLKEAKSVENVPTFSDAKPSLPVFSEPISRPVLETKEPVNSVQHSSSITNDKTAAYPDTGYEALEPRVSSVQEKPVRQRVVEDTSLPQNSVSKAEDGSDKLIITKRLKKDEPVAGPFAGRVLGRMDDRVLGNSYDGAASSAKLGMRVTKNSRPVSAWIEVFKNGTKQRVKTFYTSKGRKTKKVKLPAGNYMVRATYRTRDTKQQKTIKNIHLSEGADVSRSIAFHDGKLRVIARRGDNPLYVKVVVYKGGSHHRVTYDFSSRNSGVVQLSLSSGSYDLEVIEHKNNQLFEGIRIKAGKTNTINVDF